MTPDEQFALIFEILKDIKGQLAQLRAVVELPAPVPVATPAPQPASNQPPVLQPHVDGANPKFVLDAEGNRVCAEDFYMRGQVSCKRGAYNKHYTDAQTILGWMSSPLDFRAENHVIVPAPLSSPWSVAASRAGNPDVDWVPEGKYYQPKADEAPQARYKRWQDAGAPTRAADGRQIDVRGNTMDDDEWVKWAEKQKQRTR